MSLLGLILRHGQRLLVYPGAFFGEPQPWLETPLRKGMDYMAPFLKTPDGFNLACYFIPQTREILAEDYKSPIRSCTDDARVEMTPAAADARATVIVFHGNGEQNWQYLDVAQKLFGMGCNVLMLSYRGYSFSEGTPSEKGLMIDAQTGLDYVLSEPYLAQTPIVLLAHSLGGAVAIDLASRNPNKIFALIVSNTFTSLPDVVQRMPRPMPIVRYLPFLCTQKWASAAKMPLIPTTAPILMISARCDRVVPPVLMDRLWEAAQARRGGEKREGGSGNDLKEKEGEPLEVVGPGPADDKFVRIERAGHSKHPTPLTLERAYDLLTENSGYWEAVESFLKDIATVFIAACLALAASASPAQKRQQLAQVITQCTVPNTVALTFDDGPWLYLYGVSDALVAANAKGTFFFNGNNYGCIYNADEIKRVRYAYDNGHQVASHTWSHKDLSTLSRDQIDDELRRVEQALQRIVGVVPAFMRPPFGKYNDLVRQVSSSRGQKLVLWDFDSKDSLGATPAQSENLYDNIIAKRPSTILALNHEVYKTTVDQVLPYAIKKLQNAGYRLVTVAECLGLPAYQSVGPRGTPDVSLLAMLSRVSELILMDTYLPPPH
ncbi:hypothetical protein D9615_009076 [Tricholomella constricta]|uniref:NodB homology domain-containing protein n=1 Tax=Tricholomella constricta TaxID=117010 RepID=A0A8H5H0U4_9AGAR|nr:hypothetical protein D9615_009076 [Tricholomella constricta]